jgi:hypothetical protein
MAKCPACQTQFAIAGPATTATTATTASTATTATTASTATAPTTTNWANPAAGENPYSTPIGGGSIDQTPAPFRGANPYQPAAAVSSNETISVGSFRIGERSVEEIFAAAWAIFKVRWGSLVGAFLITFAASLGLIVVSVVVNVVANQTMNQNSAMIVNVLANFVTVPISAYLYLGLSRNALAVARDQPSPLGQLASPMLLVGRFLGGGVLLMLALCGMMGVLAGIGVVIAVLAGPELMAIGLLSAVLLVFLPGMAFAYWLLWSWPIVVADGRTNWLDAFRVAQKITLQNKLTSLLLIIVTAGLATAGLLACYIGQIVTTPLATLMLTTAYLMITTQPIADPRLPR